MNTELMKINEQLAHDPVALCLRLGLRGKKRGSEYVVELGAYGKGILPLKGAKKGLVLFTAGGPNGKQGGNMLSLVWAVMGSFPEALSFARDFLGIKESGLASSSSQKDKECLASNNGSLQRSTRKVATGFRDQLIDQNKMNDKTKMVQENWMKGEPLKDTPGQDYFLKRGLPKMDWGDQLRFSAKCWHQTLRQNLPAIMGCVRDASGRMMGLKNIFINPRTGFKADITPNKPNMGPCAGGAVQLHPISPEGVLALAEGIETALAVRALSLLKNEHIACWSVLSAGGFTSFRPPPDARQIILYPDGDFPRRLPDGTFAPGVGILSCEKAKSRFLEMGIDTHIAPTPKPGTDWLDIYSATHNHTARAQDAKPQDAKPQDAKPQDAKPQDAKPQENL